MFQLNAGNCSPRVERVGFQLKKLANAAAHLAPAALPASVPLVVVVDEVEGEAFAGAAVELLCGEEH